MDRILRRELNAISRDRTSGASELTQRAATDVLRWIDRAPASTAQHMEEIARQVLRSQPSMAGLARLANALILAARKPDRIQLAKIGAYELLAACRDSQLHISRSLRRALHQERPSIIATFSYSSTVANALIHARRWVKRVWCSECRPGLEGRRMAKELSRAGISCRFLSDAGLLDAGVAADIMILGADAVMFNGFRNKIGSAPLVASFNGPVWILADTTKFWPEDMSKTMLRDTSGPEWEIWARPPRLVRPWNPYFGIIPYGSANITVLTERGWIDPRRIHRELKKIRISPRLRELVD